MQSPDLLPDETISWLLEEENPAVRYLTLRDLLNRPVDDAELIAVQEQAHLSGPIATILAEMQDSGCWVKPGPGYYPKYRGTVWSLIMLGQLGASAAVDTRIARACAYALDHTLTAGGCFSITGSPSGTADCLQGNMCVALLDLGCSDPRLEAAFAWMARTVTGEGLAPSSDKHAALRYYASKCGPRFACGSNNKLPCAWGGIKVMLAFSRWPVERRTPLIDRAIAEGVDFLFSSDPADAEYPCGFADKPSGNWWKFGFPVFYVTDLLQNVEALVGLGYGHDPRLRRALTLIRQKQDKDGRWPLEYHYNGKTWVDMGDRKQPSKWVTLRALRVLKAAA